MPKREEIEKFLKEFKNCWDGRVLDERQDQKNDETLAILGITPKHREEEIKALKWEDYCSGPETDRDRPSEHVWIFGKKIKKYEIYIKIKIVNKPNKRKYGKCLSFHVAERPIKYFFNKLRRQECLKKLK